jgi:hypothetical protein
MGINKSRKPQHSSLSVHLQSAYASEELLTRLLGISIAEEDLLSQLRPLQVIRGEFSPNDSLL